MEVRLKPDMELRLNELASQSGRPTDEIVEDAMASYLAEVVEVRNMLDSRYDDIKTGRANPVDGETFFESLRQREEKLLKQRVPLVAALASLQRYSAEENRAVDSHGRRTRTESEFPNSQSASLPHDPPPAH